MDASEKAPLLLMNSQKLQKSKDTPGLSYGTSNTNRVRSRTVSSLRIARHISLPHAVGIMVGTLAGTGIFVSPTGVTQQVGSVGTTLVIWTLSGLFSLLLALCYAELGTALPMAGGDYAYINHVLGPLPAFLCLWLMVILLGPCAISITGRTVATYLNTMLDLDCYNSLTIFICLWLIVSAAALNCSSVKWTTRLVTVFSVGKIIAMSVIIVSGIVILFQGEFGSLAEPFKYSTTNPGSILLGFLPAFFTFGGWDCVNALAEEMVNPQRDLPLAATISLLLVTTIYILMNMAYFTVLTPLEFITSDAVAVLFAQRVMPSVVFIVPLFVIISSAGSALNLTLICPRWGFAGGRDGAIPDVISYVHINFLTPIPSILLTTAFSIFFSCALFFNIQDLLNITSLISQIKIVMALFALLVLKRREPDKPSTITIPVVFVVFSMIILIIIILLSVWQTPAVSGTAVGIFMLGAPLYYAKQRMTECACINFIMDGITKNIQMLLLVVPTRQPVTTDKDG